MFFSEHSVDNICSISWLCEIERFQAARSLKVIPIGAIR